MLKRLMLLCFLMTMSCESSSNRPLSRVNNEDMIQIFSSERATLNTLRTLEAGFYLWVVVDNENVYELDLEIEGISENMQKGINSHVNSGVPDLPGLDFYGYVVLLSVNEGSLDFINGEDSFGHIYQNIDDMSYTLGLGSFGSALKSSAQIEEHQIIFQGALNGLFEFVEESEFQTKVRYLYLE